MSVFVGSNVTLIVQLELAATVPLACPLGMQVFDKLNGDGVAEDVVVMEVIVNAVD